MNPSDRPPDGQPTPTHPETREETIARVNDEMPGTDTAQRPDPSSRRRVGTKALVTALVVTIAVGVVATLAIGAAIESTPLALAVGAGVALCAGILTTLPHAEAEDGRVDQAIAPRDRRRSG